MSIVAFSRIAAIEEHGKTGNNQRTAGDELDRVSTEYLETTAVQLRLAQAFNALAQDYASKVLKPGRTPTKKRYQPYQHLRNRAMDHGIQAYELDNTVEAAMLVATIAKGTGDQGKGMTARAFEYVRKALLLDTSRAEGWELLAGLYENNGQEHLANVCRRNSRSTQIIMERTLLRPETLRAA